MWLSRPPRKSLLAPGEGNESPLNNQRVHFDAPPFIALADKTAVPLDYWETKEERAMRKYIVTALVIAFATPALALESGVYYVGLDKTTHTCSVVTSLAPGMKMMGKFKSQAAAEKAMHGMKACKA